MVKCIYEQEAVIRLKKQVKNVPEYINEIIKRSFHGGYRIINLKEEKGVINIRFQYLLPDISRGFKAQKMAWEINFSDEIEVISIKQKEIIRWESPSYLRHLAESKSEGKIPDSYEEYWEKVKESNEESTGK